MSGSSNPIHQALLSILPPSTTIPPRLVSATNTLVSLSRQRASNLKPDEEIARPHVCAEIACKKLRAPLRLPAIRSGAGAPCRPAVYKKLLAYFGGVLEDVDLVGTPKSAKKATATPKSTGGKKRNIEELIADEEQEVETPTKRRKTDDALATPTKSTGKKTSGFVGKIANSASKRGKGFETPDYVLPAIRKLCKLFKTSNMVPHIYTGVCVVLALDKDDSDEPEDLDEDALKQKNLTCVMAIYLLTLTRMQEGPMTGEVYEAVSNKSIEALDMQEDRKDVQADVEAWISQINDEEWTSLPGKGLDWWSSVPEDVLPLLDIAGVGIEVADDDDHLTPTVRKAVQRRANGTQPISRREELKKQLEQEDPEDVLLPGLGTMMNDAVDYFSNERNAEYEIWKADVLRQIDVMEEGSRSAKKGKTKTGVASIAG